ncbi:hypothetical protein COTS27_01499 [Spirochaetota bacterium]|nr:hypothetical protein COTS27_01499 [Spirochaetota bacterium]
MRVMSQPTPNPNALKFLCERDLKSEGKATFKNLEEALTIPLAAALFNLEGVIQLHFFQNTVTVTKNNDIPWEVLEPAVIKVMTEKGPDHDPEFTTPQENSSAPRYEGELKTIDEILSRTVRPALQMDGGDLELISLEAKTLTVNYEGACHSCPSAFSGTLMAIQGILQDEYDPEIEVISN